METVFSKLVVYLDESHAEQWERSNQSTDNGRPIHRRLERALLGMEGGLIATLVMTAYRLPISRSLPPTANFWAKYVGGGEPEQYTLQAIVLHLLYGAIAGGVFGALIPERGTGSETRREARDAAWAVGYSVVLSVFGSRIMLGRILDMDLDSDEALVFHVGHLIYGLTLGTWFGSRSGQTLQNARSR